MEGTVHSSPASMTSLDVIRSWKDPRYRRNLSAQQIQTLPEHPAGAAVLTDHELKTASGLMDKENGVALLTTAFGCTMLTFGSWKACGCS